VGCIALLAMWGAACSHRRQVPPPGTLEPHFVRTFDLSSFYKGNVHTHTNLSDGDSSPEAVARWYFNHGYSFLAITDHNGLLDETRMLRLDRDGFAMIPGEEVSMWNRGHQVHVAALCTRHAIGGGEFPSASEALARGIHEVKLQGGLALINHPNFDFAISPDDVPAFRGASLLEIASGHGYVASSGDSRHPSHEALWDTALLSGIDLMAAAVDDMHRLEACSDPPAYPGKGWVQVSSPRLDRPSICWALRSGLLYASTGPALRRIAVTSNRYEVEAEDPSMRITFLGAHGALRAGEWSYAPKGDEGYVRARIDAPDGGRAWTPPVRVSYAPADSL
jgi:hypothetical protein